MVTTPKSPGGRGIKRSQCINKSLLAKRLWALQLGSKDYWAHTLKVKYSFSSARNCPSIIWRSLEAAQQICLLGKGWIVRNGQNINFWNDNWTGAGPLRKLLVGPLQVSDANIKINDLRDNNNTWYLDRLSFPLPTSLREVIHAIPHSYNSSHENTPFWLPSSNGQFLTNSAYNIALNLELKHSLNTSTN